MGLTTSPPIVLKSGRLHLWEPSGPVQAYTWIALTFNPSYDSMHLVSLNNLNTSTCKVDWLQVVGMTRLYF